ncbi:MAG: PKD domain-containing protein, partial [Bacteroidota bacterium]
SCGQLNGSASVNATGGASGYSYLWSNGQTGSSIINVLSGVYAVTITDGNGCTNSTTVNVGSIGGPTVAIASSSNVSCFGGANGSAQVNANAGVGPYTYAWIPSGGNNAVASNLSAGNYSVNVTDANGCTSSASIVITEPTVLNIQTTSTHSSCGQANGSASVNVSGGVGGYSYLWNGAQTSPSINNVQAGNYTITVTDGNGCTSSTSVSISNIGGPTVSIANSNNVSCYGGTNGSAQVNISSGTGPFTYAWTPSGGNSATASNLIAGNYSVNVTDANGCTSSTSITITQPTQLAVAIPSSTNVLCYGTSTGSATSVASNGTAGYSYQWNTGATTSTINNLAVGTYTVTATDANGCTISTSTNINQPTILSLSNINSQNVSCFGLSNGSASLTANGGTSPYQYNWNPSVSSTGNAINLAAGNFNVTVTDANGCSSSHSFVITQPSAIQTNTTIVDANCFGSSTGSIAANVSGGINPYSYNWSNGSTSSVISSLPTGNYSVTVTDANGCSDLTTWSVNEPQDITSTITSSDVSCYGSTDGAIQVAVNGGTPAYQISWTPSNSGFNLTNLPAGLYSAVITDANGCTHTLAKSIAQPLQITVNANTPSTLCIGQSQTLSLLVSGGNPSYSYLWSNLQTTSSINVSPSTTTNYSVVVTDANGCTASLNNLLVNVHPPLQLNLTANNDTICVGQSSNLSALASGGNGGPYAYSWNNGLSSSSQNVNPTQTSSYIVSVSDGCTTPNAQQAINVVVNPIPSPSFTPGNIQGCSPVSAVFNMTSASGPGNSYLWNFGDNTSSTAINPSHQYATSGSFNVTLTITNQYGCSASITNNNVVNVYPKPIAKFTPDPSETQLITANINFNNYSIGASYYNWNFGDNITSTDFSPSHMYSDTGLYEVRLIASSQQQCRDTAYEYVHIVGSFSFWCPSAFSPNDDLKNDGFTGYGVGIKSATFTIFNRWGEKIYFSDNLANPWDGSFWNEGNRCPEDVYVYLFDVVSEDNEHHKYTGRVSLVK